MVFVFVLMQNLSYRRYIGQNRRYIAGKFLILFFLLLSSDLVSSFSLMSSIKSLILCIHVHELFYVFCRLIWPQFFLAVWVAMWVCAQCGCLCAQCGCLCAQCWCLCAQCWCLCAQCGFLCGDCLRMLCESVCMRCGRQRS
uniref:Uncharacterized protein n=1 Tax=Cacopsylla melanoneura TaxID=428564 RepID=A0A8D8ZB14_9HEMI